jgi:lactate dehydrogenase-like 2-hydroxyacid dehydrogenase
MLIVGLGSIGTACARVAKFGLGMKVTGVKRNPNKTTVEMRDCCENIVGGEEFHRVVGEADYVVGVLPRVEGETDNFFNKETTFSKMKSSAVFMNIGRGTSVNEDDLLEALR